MSDDIGKIYKAALENAEIGLADYHNDFDSFIVENNENISVPVEWLDFGFLFERAVKRGWVVPGNYGPFSPPEEFFQYYGEAAPYLVKFIEMSFRAIIRQCISTYIAAGFVQVTGVDERGNFVYGVKTEPEDAAVRASVDKMLELDRQWNNL